MGTTHLISGHISDRNPNLNSHLEEESYLVCEALLRARTTFEKSLSFVLHLLGIFDVRTRKLSLSA